MKVIVAAVIVLIGLVRCQQNCPSDESGLASFATEFQDKEADDDVSITQPTLLDVAKVKVNTITISGSGKLVFGPGPITIETQGIHVLDDGALIIGSETCPYEDEVDIILQGQRTENRDLLGPEGDRYIAVTENGVLQIFGQEKRPWTKLSQTAERFSHSQFADKVDFVHLKSENANRFVARSGLMIYKFDGSTFEPTYFDVFSIGRKNVVKDTRKINDFISNVANAIQDGEVVAIGMSNEFYSGADLSDLFLTLEEISGLDNNTLLLRTSGKYDAFAMVFVKGDTDKVSQSVKKMVGTNKVETSATILHNGKKISAYSSIIYKNRGRSTVDARIMDADVGFPIIHVVHDISSWKVGDQILLTSTDYAWDHGEVRTILNIEDSHTIRLFGELNFRHFGEIEDGVDMRGEVALISRNVKIRGEMAHGCPETNGNCNRYNYDTYGGHIKIYETFGSVHIQGTELINMGQLQDKGHYPVHFHMCQNITGKTAIVKHNSIHDSYARCVTIHGTFGSSRTQLGVQVIGNVGYNIMGHCFFLEDGAEMATSLIDNLGAGVRTADNDFVTDKKKPTIYWITNPRVLMIGNVAAGSEGFGIWYTFPLEPVGPSEGLVYKYEEAKHTPIWEFDNNIVHSNIRGGMNFDNILDDENGTVVACMQYYPVAEPLKRERSPSVKVQFTRLTAYKNQEINFWLRGGWFEVMQFASADSKKGLQFARGSDQQMFLKKSIFIGKSANNQEGEDYPDGRTDASLKQYLGVVFHDGPTYIETSWFKSFKPCDNGNCVAAALGFATKNKFTSSVVSNVTDVRFNFSDPAEGYRVFDGIVDQTSLGDGNFDGDETATFRDADGTVTRCPSDTTWSYPVQVVTPEKYLLTDQCTYRENWALAICRSKYGKIKTKVNERWRGNKLDFDQSGSMKRINVNDPSDTAVEEHPDLHSSEYQVLLGDYRYYYQFQYTNEFPKDFIFDARGIERDADVVVGFCLPEGTTTDDFSLFYKSPNDVFKGESEFVFVNNLTAVFEDQHMRRVFLDGRFLYAKISSKLIRNEAWDRHDSDHCPGYFCPRFRVIMKTELEYEPCFTVTNAELSNVDALANTPRETCNLIGESPDSDWGVGDTFASHAGQWGEWTGWTKCCNAEGSIQTTTRYRLCDNPPKFGDGADCVGESSQSKDCEIECPVDGQISDWTGWSVCSCEGIGEGSLGARYRTRECEGTANGGEFCAMSTLNVGSCRGGCFEEPLVDPVDGTRSEWTEWSDCFCDGIAAGSRGVKTRSRSCEGTANGGRYCSGSMEEVRNCVGDCGYN